MSQTPLTAINRANSKGSKPIVITSQIDICGIKIKIWPKNYFIVVKNLIEKVIKFHKYRGIFWSNRKKNFLVKS